MKILLLEYISGGGLIKESIPESLAREGNLMLQSLLDDLAEIEGIRLTVMRDSRFIPPRAKAWKNDLELLMVNPEDDFDEVWLKAIRSVDAVWPIAPETGGVLEKLCRDIRECGRILINSPAEAVAKTASKLQTLEFLHHCGIDVVPSIRLVDFQDQFAGPWVIKPDDGAGCEGLQMVRDRQTLTQLKARSSAHNDIIQPFVEGAAMSLSVLFKQGDARLLSCNQQHIRIRDDFFHLSGCTVNMEPADRGVFSELARAIARAIPDLFGYAGVDLIFAERGPRVLEINPRLTTSYTALSRALNRNVAASVLELLAYGCGLPEPVDFSGISVEIRLGEMHAA